MKKGILLILFGLTTFPTVNAGFDASEMIIPSRKPLPAPPPPPPPMAASGSSQLTGAEQRRRDRRIANTTRRAETIKQTKRESAEQIREIRALIKKKEDVEKAEIAKKQRAACLRRCSRRVRPPAPSCRRIESIATHAALQATAGAGIGAVIGSSIGRYQATAKALEFAVRMGYKDPSDLAFMAEIGHRDASSGPVLTGIAAGMATGMVTGAIKGALQKIRSDEEAARLDDLWDRRANVHELVDRRLQATGNRAPHFEDRTPEQQDLELAEAVELAEISRLKDEVSSVARRPLRTVVQRGFGSVLLKYKHQKLKADAHSRGSTSSTLETPELFDRPRNGTWEGPTGGTGES